MFPKSASRRCAGWVRNGGHEEAMAKLRIGLVGLGMAVTPHAKGLLDLKDRVEVVYAFSPSALRREAFASRFPFPLCERLESILDDRSIDAVCVLTPANTHLDIVRRC